MDHVYNGYKILGDGTFGYYEIHSKAQGQIPKGLKGSFTTRPLAMRAIDAYVETKGKKNGSAKASN